MAGSWEEFRSSAFAVLFGVDRYADDALGSLAGAANDARRLSAALTAPASCGIPPGNVTCIAGEVTRENALAELDRLAERANDLCHKRTGDVATTLLFFSGHGVVDDQGARHYLCFTDTDRNDLEDTAISDQELAERLAGLPTRWVVVILACCHPFGLNQSTLAFFQGVGEGGGRVVITSASEGQESWEDPTAGHDIFVRHLIDILSGRTDVQAADGVVWLADAWEHLSREVPREVRAAHNKAQTPKKWEASGGRMPLAAMPHARGRPPVRAPEWLRGLLRRAVAHAAMGAVLVLSGLFVVLPLWHGHVLRTSRHPDAQQDAASRLLGLRGPVGMSFLRTAVLERDDEVTFLTVTALGNLGGRDAAEVLAAGARRRGGDNVAIACVRALGETHGERGREALLAFLRDEAGGPATTGRLLPEVGRALLRSGIRNQTSGGEDLPRAMRSIVAEVSKLLSSPDPKLKWRAAVTLQQFRGWDVAKRFADVEKDRYSLDHVLVQTDKLVDDAIRRTGLTTAEHPDTGIQFVYVPSGEFLMGWDPDLSAHLDRNGLKRLSEDDLRRETSYGSTVRVRLDGFWIGVTEVTNEQFGKAGRGPSQARSRSEWDREPVVSVKWAEAQRFCEWLGGHLPTEAEWEKAANGGEDVWPGSLGSRVWPWGNDLTGGRGNCLPDSGRRVRKVGEFPAGKSPYGCLDMSGNVWEWCYDWYNKDIHETPFPNLVTFEAQKSKPMHVERGGSFTWGWERARCASRANNSYENCAEDVGFRCAM